ncbi:hypothetical protein SmJEL517_g03719 [Synchytrium microbalum]|uniref:RRM domain-containing protein n=1 Tax=Synchytrium microbalum TaxID=1806994 RepID=A0A507BWW5_9FUNG|nr:uncharacterized protein SmJEL517_g03719 [Synchytrium microbalum]TPX33307.1 hypothetical protein SmJEL517_g03719 [Synchytrium microbalum]
MKETNKKSAVAKKDAPKVKASKVAKTQKHQKAPRVKKEAAKPRKDAPVTTPPSSSSKKAAPVPTPKPSKVIKKTKKDAAPSEKAIAKRAEKNASAFVAMFRGPIQTAMSEQMEREMFDDTDEEDDEDFEDGDDDEEEEGDDKQGKDDDDEDDDDVEVTFEGMDDNDEDEHQYSPRHDDEEDEEPAPKSSKSTKSKSKTAATTTDSTDTIIEPTIATEEADEFATNQSEILLDPSMNALADTINAKKRKRTAASIKNSNGKSTPGVIYLGRIPHGFYEREMKTYFTQFGKVSRLKLSRNKKTGHSKHYAFIEFEDAEVAKIVAETMHNYLMMNCLLQCKFMPEDEVHPDTFKNTEKPFRPIPFQRLHRQKHNRTKTPEQHAKQVKSLVEREQAKRQKLQEMGIDYDFSGYEALTATAK